jgi:hypothetical protein
VLLLGATIGAPSSALAQTRLVERFDRAYAWFQEEALLGTDGYILRHEPVYSLSVSLEPIEGAFRNVPDAATHQATEQVKGRYLLASVSNACVYVSTDRDFADAPCTERLAAVGPVLPKWYLTTLTEDTVELNYGSIHYNAWVSVALIDAYHATGSDRYLDEARRILRASAQHVDPETGKAYRFRVDDDQPTYVAMIQSWLMQATWAYLQTAGPDDAAADSLRASLETLARSYEHTSRGVWNHWTSSRIGQLIAEDVLNRSVVDDQQVREELAELRRQIRELGKIPYIMDPDHPKFPDHRATYYTYDLRLLAKFAAMVPVDTQAGPFFGDMLSEASKVNYDYYFGNNTYAALYAHIAFGEPVDAFMRRQRVDPLLQQPPGSIKEAVGQLQGIAALLRYRQEVGCRDGAQCGPGSPYTGVEAAAENDAIRFEWTSHTAGVEGWAVEHRPPQKLYCSR